MSGAGIIMVGVVAIVVVMLVLLAYVVGEAIGWEQGQAHGVLLERHKRAIAEKREAENHTASRIAWKIQQWKSAGRN